MVSMYGIFTYIYHKNQPFMYRYIYHFLWILWVLTWSCTRRTGRSWSTLRRDQLEGSTGVSHKTLWVQWYIIHLGGGFKYCICSPRSLGKWSNLTNIFQMGWFNHQLVIDFIPYPGYSWLEICTKKMFIPKVGGRCGNPMFDGPSMWPKNRVPHDPQVDPYDRYKWSYFTPLIGC